MPYVSAAVFLLLTLVLSVGSETTDAQRVDSAAS
jgi:hypothetical protein